MAKILELNAEDEEKLCSVGTALSSPARIQILKLLYYNSYNVKEIAEKLHIPASTAALHIRTLEAADIINTKIQPGSRGSMKLCSRKHDFINIHLSGNDPNINKIKSISMPIGCYTDCLTSPTCGLASSTKMIGYGDSPNDFYLPGRINAQILWTSSGYVEYKFPNFLSASIALKRLILSFEVCSEAPNYKENWCSDITVWMNGLDCGTWRSAGDYGARRGRLNPEWWGNGVTQYGKLMTLEVTPEGTLINSNPSSAVSLRDLHLSNETPIAIRIGNKPGAEHVGGFNIFGKQFGDFEQDIILSMIY
ncbi:MAG TPA: ArsR family transcriptional regulator [Candidatus Limiplasma sp.]|nr:ArsR family transcriptional regulator [Candidatus Limiplasma sp.]